MKTAIGTSTATTSYAPSELEALRMEAAHLHDCLRTALELLTDAPEPFYSDDWELAAYRKYKAEFIKAVTDDHFNGSAELGK